MVNRRDFDCICMPVRRRRSETESDSETVAWQSPTPVDLGSAGHTAACATLHCTLPNGLPPKGQADSPREQVTAFAITFLILKLYFFPLNTGRVHSACISGINPGTDSVTVEWFERGDTKGKEIEISAIFALNPNLAAPAEPPPPAAAPPVQSHIPAPKSRISSAKAAHPESNRPSAKPTPRETRGMSSSPHQSLCFCFEFDVIVTFTCLCLSYPI
nr:uncharacterized protein LOC129271356 [Lytechinus pictus]